MVRQHRLGAQELGLSGHQTSQSPLTTCGGLSPLYTKGASLPRQIQPAKKVCEGGILPTNYDLIVIFLQNQSHRKTCGSGGSMIGCGSAVWPSGHRTSVPLDPFLSPASCVARLSAPGVINHHPVGALMQSWPSAEPRPVQCLGSHTALPRWAGWLKKGKEGALV